MQVKVLGAAAGGGLPQWNCHCEGCAAVRAGSATGLTQSSIAVQAGDGSWFLVNASPDVRQQIERLRQQAAFPAPDSPRSSPFAGILLTDAEIDHTTGLILLRESSQPLRVYSTVQVKRALTTGYPLFSTLQHYCGVEWRALEPGVPLQLTADLEVEPIALSTKPPKYMEAVADIWGVGFTFRDRTTGGVLTYTPGLGAIDEPLRSRFAASDCILVDGTFWTNEELPGLGIGCRTAQQMGHLPLSGVSGSLDQLATLPTPRKILVHINNTNPILRPHTPERQYVEAAGIEIGYDGLTIQL